MDRKVICVLAIILTVTLSTLVEGTVETCDVRAHERQNCGYPDVTREACEKKGCCFDDNVARVPWCYHPMEVANPEEECEF